MVEETDILRLVRSGDRRTLPRLITLVENYDPRGIQALDALYPHTGKAHIVGITGPPGVGKSTLIASLVEEIRASASRVAVLAIDPSSPLTGGAVLGDRVRMMARHADPGLYVRSMASRGRQGGLAWSTAALVHLLDAAGFPVILVETVGAGQDGADIGQLADTVVVVQSAGQGDGVQTIKSGMLEFGDVVAVNKADQPGTDDTVRLLRSSFALAPPATGWSVPVVATDALAGSGVNMLLTEISAHSEWLDTSGDRARRRERRAQAEVLTGIRMALDARIIAESDGLPVVREAIARVARREMSPHQAIAAINAALTAA